MKFELRPMSIGDILDTTFNLYRARFVPFLTIALTLYIPFGVIMALYQTQVVRRFPRVEAGRMPVEEALMLLAVSLGFLGVLLLFLLIVFPICQGAMIHQISTTFLGERISGGESYRRSLPRVIPLLLTNLRAGLIILCGFILLIVPGVIFSLWYMLAPALVMLEKVRGKTALERSRELMRENLGKGFLLMLVVSLLGILITSILDLLVKITGAPEFLQVFLSMAFSGLVLPVQTAALILFYYDLRIRKEAFDLQRLAADLGLPDLQGGLPGGGPPAGPGPGPA